MQDEWIFIFFTEPMGLPLPIAIFPPEMSEEAIEYAGENEEFELRKSTWRFGEIPNYRETLPFVL